MLVGKNLKIAKPYVYNVKAISLKGGKPQEVDMGPKGWMRNGSVWGAVLKPLGSLFAASWVGLGSLVGASWGVLWASSEKRPRHVVNGHEPLIRHRAMRSLAQCREPQSS